MQLLTVYQQSEILFGTLYFFFIYSIIIYIMSGELNLVDITVTSVLFMIWLFIVKIVSNYIIFTNKSY